MSSKSINETIVSIREVLKTIRGLNVPEGIPDSISELPCVIVVPEEGTFNADFGGADSYTVMLTLLVGKADMPSVMNKLIPFFEEVKEKFNSKMTLNDSVDYCALTSFADVGRHEFGGIEYFGAALILSVKE